MDEFIEILKAKKASYSIDGDRICVEGWLDLSHSNITSLPDNLSVGSYLDLSHTNITDLPDNLSVDYLLGISKTNITSLPDNLSVGGWLDLNGTEITSLPDNLSVGCSLYLQPKNIDNIAYREHCGRSNRTIFAAWLNGGIRLSAGCFLNTLSEFEKAVDLKYSGKDAEDYKQAARECVAELTQRRKNGGAA